MISWSSTVRWALYDTERFSCVLVMFALCFSETDMFLLSSWLGKRLLMFIFSYGFAYYQDNFPNSFS